MKAKNIFFIILFTWISFFPRPVQEKYSLFVNIFLFIAFGHLLLRKRKEIYKLGDYPMWVFLAATGINVFFAQQRNLAFNAYLNIALPMFFIYYLISEDFFSEGKFDLLAKIVGLCSIGVSLIGIFECIFRYNPLYAHLIENPYYLRYISGFARPMSTQFNPTPLGGYLLGCLPFNYYLFKKTGSILRSLGVTGIVLNITVLILTFSRAAILGLFSMALFYLFLRRKYKLIAVLAVALFMLFSTFYYLPYPLSKLGMGWIFKDKLLPNYLSGGSYMAEGFLKDHPEIGPDRSKGASFADGDGILSSYRLERCAMALRMLKSNPLSGLGLQHFRARFYEYYRGKYRVPYDIMIADNMYLTILAEAGLIGFFAFLLFIFIFLRRGREKLARLNNGSLLKLRLSVCLTALIGLLVNMAGYEFFYWPNQYLFFCVIVGCLNASLRINAVND
ncbi:MAG: O-antigen ligase family protein [Candidatus Omnitrophica bacterium]|nr:O-antigen ligase family protein [Candidatus Omnitrophota bacterium]MDD5553801.1 O-antigen ligase family protein [Candidatus Omnitrophota bacterium]